MSTATITEPSIETSTATDRLTEALEQKLSRPATSPDFDLHAETNAVLKDIGLTTADAGGKLPAKARISRWTCARHCGVSPDSLKTNGKPSMAGRHPQVAMRLAHS